MRRTLLFLLVALFTALVSLEETSNVHFCKDHVGVWFDYYVRPHLPQKSPEIYTRKELKEMVKVVSKRFSKIAIPHPPLAPKDKFPTDPEAFSRSWIPSVVAELNKENENAPGKNLSVIVSFAQFSQPWLFGPVEGKAVTENLTSYDVARYMADAANKIHPGTVTTLMLDNDRLQVKASAWDEGLILQLKAARDNLDATGKPYKLACILDLGSCGQFRGALGNHASHILPFVDIIVPVIRQDMKPYPHNDPEIEHQMLTAIAEDCEKKLKMGKPRLEVIHMFHCKPRRMEEVGNYSKCWQLISSWAEKNNKDILMFEAFDHFDDNELSARGWWRTGNVKEKITENTFQEKIQDAIPQQKNKTIDSDKLGVYLFPFTLHYDNESNIWLSNEEAKSIVETVSTRFHTIFLHFIPSTLTVPQEEPNIHNSARISVAAANYNRNLSSNPSYEGNPINLIMSYRAKEDEEETSIKNALYLADATNDLYPGTVSLIVHIPVAAFTSPIQISPTLQQLYDVSRLLHNGTSLRKHKYKLGTVIEAIYCSDWKDTLVDGLAGEDGAIHWVDSVIVFLNQTDELLHLDPVTVHGIFMKQFENCKGRLTGIKEGLEVIPMMNCNGARRGTKNNLRDTIWCWQLAGEWGKELGKEIIMLEAFDAPRMDRYWGWWKLKNEAVSDLKEGSFVEKMEEVNWSHAQVNEGVCS